MRRRSLLAGQLFELGELALEHSLFFIDLLDTVLVAADVGKDFVNYVLLDSLLHQEVADFNELFLQRLFLQQLLDVVVVAMKDRVQRDSCVGNLILHVLYPIHRLLQRNLHFFHSLNKHFFVDSVGKDEPEVLAAHALERVEVVDLLAVVLEV